MESEVNRIIDHRFPCQDQVGGDSKIPTIIYYDKDGNVRAVGAEATRMAWKILLKMKAGLK